MKDLFIFIGSLAASFLMACGLSKLVVTYFNVQSRLSLMIVHVGLGVISTVLCSAVGLSLFSDEDDDVVVRTGE